MPTRFNRNIEVLEPLLLMSATAIDGADADLSLDAAAPEANPFEAFAAFVEEAAEENGFGEDVLKGLDDLTAAVQPVKAEGVNEILEAVQEKIEDVDLAELVNGFAEAAEERLTIAVAPPVPEANLPPVAVHDYNFTNAGESVSGSVLCNDVDPNGDSLTAWLKSSPENGSLEFHSDGTYTYVPNDGYSGVDTFVYVVADGRGGCSSTSVSIEVAEPVEECAPNEAPVAVDDAATTDFETSVTGNVLDNDSDVEGDALQAWVETGPTSGSIELNPDGSYVYTPIPGFSGTDTFTYSVNDAEGNTSYATVTIEVGPAPVNEAPIVNDDSVSTDFGREVSGNVLVNDSDPEGDRILAWVEEGPQSGSIELGPDGAYIYTPNPGFSGTDTFTYTVTDDYGNCSKAIVTVEVGPAPVNEGPVAVDDTATTDFETSVSGNVLSNDSDPEGDALQAWVEVGPENGSIQMNPDGSYVYTPVTGFSGTDSFTYSVTDEAGNCTTAVVSIDVGAPPANEGPVAVDDAATTDFETPVTGNVLNNDSDPEGDALQAWVETGPNNGSIEMKPDGSYVYTPIPGFSGNDAFTYSVNDSYGNTTTAMVTIEVAEPEGGCEAEPEDGNENQPPVAVDDATTTPFETAVTGNVLTNDSDPDGDVLQPNVVTPPGNGSVVLNDDGTYVYTPDGGFSGTDSFQYTVTDNDGTPSTATVTITVGDPAPPANEPPVAVDDSNTTPFETSVTGNVLTNDSDPEGAPLQITVSTPPANGSLVLNEDGSYVYTPNAGFSGTDTFLYMIVDNGGAEASATVTITVDEPVNQGPIAVDDSASGMMGEEITGNVITNDSDPDGDELSVAPITDFVTVEGGTVVLKADGTFVYEPAEGYSGFDSFTYELSDSEGNRTTATVAIEVKPLPIGVQDDSYTILNNGTTITGNVTDNDGDNGNVIVQLVDGPESGSLVLADDGSFEYLAEDGFSGRDSFEYVLVRGNQTSEVATASIIVSKVQYDTSHEAVGKGWVWGDPHFKGEDGGFYDVQGDPNKTYSLLSDNDLQVNALFIPWDLHPGSTMMGAIGVTSGSDQIVADLQETQVNGVVIQAGQTIELDNCTVTYDGQYTTITTDEYELELNRRNGWYDMKLESLDPFSDNVAPHGLWGLTVDADTDPRDGDFFKTDGWDFTLQGGGAIDTINEAGEIVRTEKGDRTAYKLYETADLLSVEALNSEAADLFRFAAAEGTGLSPI